MSFGIALAWSTAGAVVSVLTYLGFKLTFFEALFYVIDYYMTRKKKKKQQKAEGDRRTTILPPPPPPDFYE